MILQNAVYILKCNNDTYYTGYTTNIKLRFKAHNNKEVHYTKDKLPVKLVYLSLFKTNKKRTILKAI